MFGYVRPLEPELRVRELEDYRAVYCGLCHALARHYGPLCRATLSFDFTFTAMLFSALSDDEPKLSPKRCPLNPLKKRPHLESCPAVDYSCDIAMLLVREKFRDNVLDSRGVKSALWRVPTAFASGAARQAVTRHPQADAVAATLTARQAAVEQSEHPTVDEACDPTARTLGGLFALMAQSDAEKRILERLGYMLGRYVYLCDAIDDLPQDRERRRFNPLDRAGTSADEVAFILNATIAEACSAYALLTPKHFTGVLDNIVYLGLSHQAGWLLRQSADALSLPPAP